MSAMCVDLEAWSPDDKRQVRVTDRMRTLVKHTDQLQTDHAAALDYALKTLDLQSEEEAW